MAAKEAQDGMNFLVHWLAGRVRAITEPTCIVHVRRLLSCPIPSLNWPEDALAQACADCRRATNICSDKSARTPPPPLPALPRPASRTECSRAFVCLAHLRSLRIRAVAGPG